MLLAELHCSKTEQASHWPCRSGCLKMYWLKMPARRPWPNVGDHSGAHGHHSAQEKPAHFWTRKPAHFRTRKLARFGTRIWHGFSAFLLTFLFSWFPGFPGFLVSWGYFLVLFFPGYLVSRFPGLLVSWGLLVCWFSGLLVFCWSLIISFPGYLVSWLPGLLVSRASSFRASRFPGFLVSDFAVSVLAPFCSPNSVSRLRGSYGRCKGRSGCSFWAPAFFLYISIWSGSCEMLKCISTAQARTKYGPRFWGAAFSCKFLYKVALAGVFVRLNVQKWSGLPVQNEPSTQHNGAALKEGMKEMSKKFAEVGSEAQMPRVHKPQTMTCEQDWTRLNKIEQNPKHHQTSKHPNIPKIMWFSNITHPFWGIPSGNLIINWFLHAGLQSSSRCSQNLHRSKLGLSFSKRERTVHNKIHMIHMM